MTATVRYGPRQGDREAKAISAQCERETEVIKAQLDRPSWLLGLARAAVGILGLLLIIAGFANAMTRAGDLTNKWAIVITAFVAAVTMVAVGLSSIGSRRNIVLGAAPSAPTPTPAPTPAPTSAPASGTGSATTSTASQTSASIVAQEPAMLTAIIIAGLQVLVIAGFTGAADEATQATIVGGLTALGGILIRGRVSPTQTQVTTK